MAHDRIGAAARVAGRGPRRVVIGSLFAFKFYDFLAGEIERCGRLGVDPLPRLGLARTPAGYSFYAFSAASYLIDTYARRLSDSAAPATSRSTSRTSRRSWPARSSAPRTFCRSVAAGLRAEPDACSCSACS